MQDDYQNEYNAQPAQLRGSNQLKKALKTKPPQSSTKPPNSSKVGGFNLQEPPPNRPRKGDLPVLKYFAQAALKSFRYEEVGVSVNKTAKGVERSVYRLVGAGFILRDKSVRIGRGSRMAIKVTPAGMSVLERLRQDCEVGTNRAPNPEINNNNIIISTERRKNRANRKFSQFDLTELRQVLPEVCASWLERFARHLSEETVQDKINSFLAEKNSQKKNIRYFAVCIKNAYDVPAKPQVVPLCPENTFDAFLLSNHGKTLQAMGVRGTDIHKTWQDLRNGRACG